VVAALVLSAISYRAIEQPVRHNTWLSADSARSLGAAGLALSLSFSAVVVLFAVLNLDLVVPFICSFVTAVALVFHFHPL
jgi:hypothetical protein